MLTQRRHSQFYTSSVVGGHHGKTDLMLCHHSLDHQHITLFVLEIRGDKMQTIYPSVTITPVYSAKGQRAPPPLPPPVTVQLEPVDLTTKPPRDGHHEIATARAIWQLKTLSSHSPTGNNVGLEERTKLDRVSEWSKSKKVHRCGHPGCDKVKLCFFLVLKVCLVCYHRKSF